jgi:hypothetical protein
MLTVYTNAARQRPQIRADRGNEIVACLKSFQLRVKTVNRLSAQGVLSGRADLPAIKRALPCGRAAMGARTESHCFASSLSQSRSCNHIRFGRLRTAVSADKNSIEVGVRPQRRRLRSRKLRLGSFVRPAAVRKDVGR